MFIKHGDGKVLDVISEDELTEEQIKNAKKLNQTIKQSDEQTDSSDRRQSGR